MVATRPLRAAPRMLACLLALLPAASALHREPQQRLARGSAAAPSAATATSGSTVELLEWDAAWQRANETVAQMTPQEMYTLLRGTHFNAIAMSPESGYYIGNMEPVPRLGIPPLKMQDAAQGFRITGPPGVDGTTTSWPSMLALAATWDEATVETVAAAVGTEFRGKGANVILGPSLNVHRVARNGRNFEYLSGEDPYLGARLAAAHVRGLQGQGVMAVAKHYAFNEQETHRDTESSMVDARTAWELYYPPFEAAVDAGIGAIMCSYNRVNGSYASQSTDILVRDLRQGMGFRGFVMSDWGAVHDIAALANGLQMEMPGLVPFPGGISGTFVDSNLEKVPPALVSEAAQRVLTSVYRLRLDEQPGCTPPCNAELASNQTSPAHRQLAREVAAKSIVLLKNAGGVLPITSSAVQTIAVFGKAANAADMPAPFPDFYAGGGSGKVGGGEVARTLQGIQRRAEAANITVLYYGDKSTEEAVQLAQGADLAIVVGATTSCEGIDRVNLALDDFANDLISKLAAARGQDHPTVVLMQTPGAVLTPWRNEVQGIAQMFLGGEATGDAWADVLFGDAEPSGRLPLMMPVSQADTISPGTTLLDLSVVYSEGLFTSYRNPNFTAAFPFGFGLAYTTFSYGEPEVVSASNCAAAACVSIRITNSGARPGSEVAQAYLHYPSDSSRPSLALKGFKRTSLLAPSASEELLFEFTPRDLSVYTAEAGWTRVPDVDVRIGPSSADLPHTVPLVRSMSVV